MIVDPCALQASVPIWVGGRTGRSLHRAITLADGWAPFGLAGAELKTMLAAARETDAWATRGQPLEAIAWGLERGVEIDGVLLTDPACAGSDTLATARAVVAALNRTGPFDLVLTGRNSVDADTGQVPPAIAELTGLAFLTGVRNLTIDTNRVVHAGCEHDDGWIEAEVRLPVVLSAAERLIDPCKVEPAGRASVPLERLRTFDADDLGLDPWGAAASRTVVGDIRVIESERLGARTPDASLSDQVERAVDLLVARGALDPAESRGEETAEVPASLDDPSRILAVVVEPDRDEITRE